MRPRDVAKKVSVVLTERPVGGIMSAYAMVALGRYPHTDWMGRLSEKDHQVIQWAIHAVGADDLADRNVAELSDGERQKVMMARAFAQESKVMVLDEITAFLDLPRRVEIMRILRQVARTTDRAILLSTHDLDLALRTADRIWLLPKRGALQVGIPECLILSGAFESVFGNEGVDFDREQGSFKLHREPSGEIHFEGEGIVAIWTARALEREGFRLLRGSSAQVNGHFSVGVTTVNGTNLWIFQSNGVSSQYESLEDLLSHVRDHAFRTHEGSL
jgi:iron complex transport system ATP-binding protein